MTEIPGTPEVQIPLTTAMVNILIALVDGEKHSFAIVLEIEAFSNGDFALGPGTMFSSIKRLIEAGLVEQSDERIDPNLDDQRRRYYRMTGLGQRSLQLELQRKSSRGIINPVNDLLGSSFMGGA